MQRLWTTITRCVRYDVEFQQRLAEEMQSWEAAGQPKRTTADVAGEYLASFETFGQPHNPF